MFREVKVPHDATIGWIKTKVEEFKKALISPLHEPTHQPHIIGHG